MKKKGRDGSLDEFVSLIKRMCSTLDRTVSVLEGQAPRKVTPEARGCDARRCSKHIYSGSAYCEFCCLPMSEHATP